MKLLPEVLRVERHRRVIVVDDRGHRQPQRAGGLSGWAAGADPQQEDLASAAQQLAFSVVEQQAPAEVVGDWASTPAASFGLISSVIPEETDDPAHGYRESAGLDVMRTCAQTYIRMTVAAGGRADP